MQVQGKIKTVGETQTFGDNGFRKRELVVVTAEQYPQSIMIEFVQDKCDLLNSFQVGQDVKVSINLRGREWVNPQGETKYFNSIQGWRIESDNDDSQAPVQPADPVAPSNDVESDNDDLPF